MSKELVKKEEQTTAVSLSAVDLAEQSLGEDILSSAIVIPRLLLMQALSDFVQDEEAKNGDMVKSTTKEVLGNENKAVEFIPITFTNTWILSEKVGNRFEFRGQEPLVAANQDLPWEFEKNGVPWKRTKSVNVYAILPSELAAEKEEMEKVKAGGLPDPDKALMPILISFRSTGYKAGKDVITHFAKARKFGLPGFVKSLRLQCKKEKNDMGTYYVFQVSPGSPVSKEDFKVCEYWRDMIGQNKVQVDTSAEDKEGAGLSESSEY